MKFKHSNIWSFARVGATLAPFIFALLFFACKGQHSNKNQDQLPVVSKEEEMTFQMLKGEWSSKNFVSFSDVIPTSGIPYTATAREINEKEKLILKVIRKDEKVPLCPIPKIISPSSNSPLLIGATTYYDEKNVFALTFKKVEVATPVKIRIYSEEFTSTSINRTYKDLTITVLPEPSIESVTGGDISLPIGIDYDLSKESVTFTCTPSKIGELDASYYLLKDSKTITYVDSSSPNVATVTQEGVVKTLTAGETNIKITTKNGKVGNIKVKVEEKKVPDSITCATRKLTLSPGESQNITLVPSPHDAVLNLSEWTSTDAEVGKIEKIGSDELNYKITALEKGNATFKAYAKYRKSTSIEINLAVTDTKLESISIEPARISLQREETKQLKVVATPSEASMAVSWESNEPNIVSVNDGGQITGLQKGEATITATSLSDSNKKATCTVTVTEKIEKIELNHKVAELLNQETLQLTATISPAAAPQEVIWKTEKFDLGGWDPDQIAKVDKNGLVTAGEYRTGYVKVIATSKIDPSKKAECIVSVAGTKVSKIEVSDGTINMHTNTERELTIEVFPAQAANKIGCDIEGDNLKAEYIVNMPTHPEKSTCKLKAGSIPEVKTITFYSLTNPEKKAKVKVTITRPQGAVPTSFSIKNIEPNFVHYGDAGNATITFETQPAGSDAGFVFESVNDDLSFDATADPNKYIIKVKNKSAKSKTVEFSVKSSTAPALPKQKGTIQIKSVVPTRLEILGDDKMYLDETLEFTVKTNDATPQPSRDVEWKVESRSTPKEQIKLEKVSSNGRVKVSFIGDKSKLVDTSFDLIATSNLNNAIKATKYIKIYKNFAKIQRVSYNSTEYTITTSYLNNELYNTRRVPPKLSIKLMGNVEHQHLEFIISDKETLSKEEDYLSSGLGFVGRFLKIDPSEYTESNKTITRELKPDRNTKGEERVFYIHPVDPKLRSAGVIKVPSTHYNKGSFSLLVWDEPTGIEVFKVENAGSGEKSFTIHKQDDGAYQSETITRGTNGYVFYVRTKPEYANPKYLEWKTEKVSGNYMCIQNPECSSAPDENGRWRFKFNTNTNNSWGKKDWAKFLFSIKVLNPKVVSEKHDLDPPVTNYLLIKSN